MGGGQNRAKGSDSKEQDYTKQSENPVYPMPFEVQIEFEQADLQGDNEWFRKNWPVYSQGMGGHVLDSYLVCKWVGFQRWLAANPEKFNTKSLLRCIQGKAEEVEERDY